MRRVRGLRDINTHGTLAREGRLVSVAKDWHRINGRSGCVSSEEKSWDGSVDRMVFKRDAEMRRPSRDLFRDFALERKIREAQIVRIREFIAEMEMFASEGLPGALVELHRLKAKLSRWERI